MVSPDLQVRIPPHHALGRHHFTADELEQRGLSGTVGPHQRQPRVQVEAKLEVLVDKRRSVAVSKAYVLKSDQWDYANAFLSVNIVL